MNWNFSVKYPVQDSSMSTLQKPAVGKIMQLPKCHPYLTGCGIGFTTNCEDLCKSFEDWSTDHVFDNVLSWDLSTWLAEWSVDTLR